MNQKILLVGWGYPPKIDGGLDIHVKHLFEELRDRDIDVSLALPSDRAPERESIVPVETGEGDMVQRSRKMSQEITKIAKEYDIIHTHDWFGAESGFKAQKYSNVKWISTFHSLSSGRNRKADEKLEKMEKVAVEQPDKIISVSEKLSDEINEIYSKKPEVVHNGFSVPSNSGADIKEELGIENKMIFFVGRHAEQKGIEHLIYGFKKLLNERDATLVIGGKGHMTESLREFAEILGIEDKVAFTGFIEREKLGDYYSSADVFVSPSINEPFGLTITEALESGTPVVATDNGVEEITSENVIKVRPESESIKEGILKALNLDFTEIENRTWDEMTEETIEIYKKLA